MNIPRSSSYRPFYRRTAFWLVVLVEIGLLSAILAVACHFIAKYW